jgi:hypothetical protein
MLAESLGLVPPWRPGCGRWWHRDRDAPIGQEHGLLAHRRIDRLHGLVMCGEDLFQGVVEIL